MVDSVIWDIGYLVSAALFILGIKRLSSPKTAPQGNRLGAYGMSLAAVSYTHLTLPTNREV